MAKISDLPNELLWYFFRKISPKELKRVVLVSRRWGKVGDDPVLWDWCFIKIKNEKDIQKLFVVRFNHVQRISVKHPVSWMTDQIEKLFEAILQLPKLKKISGLWDLNVRAVNTELIVKVLVKMEWLKLTDDWITNDQKSALFRALSDANSCVKTLTLSGMDLCTVNLEADLLAQVMTSMENLELAKVSFSSDQAEELFKSISESSTLNYFNFYELNFPSVEPEEFGKALANIEVVSLDLLKMSSPQAQAFFKEMGRNSRIKFFDSIEGDLSLAEPHLLAKGLSNLEEASLMDTSFTDEQVVALFTELSENCTKLKMLDLANNDLSAADPDKLANAVTKIQKVDLSETSLDTDQINSVMSRAVESTKLEQMIISVNEMSEVDLIHLANAVVNLKEMDLRDTNLSTEQINAILMRAQEDMKLEMLDMSDNNMSEVDPENLANFVNKIDNVKLRNTQLNEQHLTAILTTIDENTQLKKLYISGNSTSEVEPAIITRANELIDQLGIDTKSKSNEGDDEDGPISDSDTDT